ncbi:MAG: aminotransferase class IV [Saprospiraceae bacterium]
MYRLFESIKVSEGEIYHWELHRQRMYSSLHNIYGEEHILEAIERTFSEKPSHGLYKLRIIYDHRRFQMEYNPYVIRTIRKLYLKHHDTIIYDHKYSDRTQLNQLTQNLLADEDILIIKNGMLTDSSYSNVALFDGSHWFTPSQPLLKGIKRKWLIDQHEMLEKDIMESEIRNYKKIAFINAMMDLGELTIDTNSIITSANSV